MKNIDMKIVGENTLVISIDLSKNHGPSKSGKSIGIATTEGNVDLSKLGHPDIKVGVNVYRKK